MIKLQLFTGLRIGEVLALKVKDFDKSRKLLKIQRTITRDQKGSNIVGKDTKTEAGTRTILLNEKALKVMNEQLQNRIININGFIFAESKPNEFYSPSAVNSYLKRLNEKCHITASSLHTHKLRHTFATRCVEAGVNIKVLSQILGHENIETTLNTYTTVTKDLQNSEVEKIENYLNIFIYFYCQLMRLNT